MGGPDSRLELQLTDRVASTSRANRAIVGRKQVVACLLQVNNFSCILPDPDLMLVIPGWRRLPKPCNLPWVGKRQDIDWPAIDLYNVQISVTLAIPLEICKPFPPLVEEFKKPLNWFVAKKNQSPCSRLLKFIQNSLSAFFICDFDWHGRDGRFR